MRLIDADELRASVKEKIKNRFCVGGWHTGLEDFLTEIDNASTITPESLRAQGKWIKYSSDEWICSSCSEAIYCDTLDGGVLPNYCPNCGAKMEAQNETD